MNAPRLVLIALSVLAFTSLIAQEKVVIEDGFESLVLGNEIGVYQDHSGSISFRDALGKSFTEAPRRRPNLGFIDGALWLKTEVRNNSGRKDFIYQINQPVLDSVALYFLDKNQTVRDSLFFGEAYPYESRPFKERYFIVPFELEPGESMTIMTRVVTREQVILPIYISTPAMSRDMMSKADILFGAYFGLILVMALYNLFIYFSVKDKSYLLYVIYILIVGITQAALEGYTHKYFWPNSHYLASRSIYVFTTMVSISSMVFLIQFLKTRFYAPTLNKVSYLLIGLFTAVGIASLFSVGKFVHIASQIGITLVAFYIFSTSIIVYRKGYSAAKYFLLAWSALLVGIIVYALKDAGLIPSTPFTNYLLQGGSAVEAVLLSLALADRINILKREKAASQAQALHASRENERIVKEQNVILESRVKKRTEALEKSNDNLTNTLDELKNAQSQLVNAEKMASLGQLTAGVAHEINNPINFVSANIKPLRYDFEDLVKLIEKYESIKSAEEFENGIADVESFKSEIDLDYLKNEIVELLNGIQEGANRTAEIVKSLKVFSRLDEESVKEFDLNEGLHSTLNILQSKITQDVKIELDLADTPPVECLGGKINQVFMNIIGNAIDAVEGSEKDEKLIRISSKTDDEFVYFEITDNGTGMKPATLNKIFEPFYTTKDVGKGTGLGLSISYNIVKTHSGDINVSSELGKGSTFMIKLPKTARIQNIEQQRP
ncbi:MAG: 7TM diverse intracellular signaling domain-containing protein [Cryomorphaceae bacterium]|nr:GHKL domain-containing protein [Flavobacteriales bacterium]